MHAGGATQRKSVHPPHLPEAAEMNEWVAVIVILHPFLHCGSTRVSRQQRRHHRLRRPVLRSIMQGQLPRLRSAEASK